LYYKKQSKAKQSKNKMPRVGSREWNRQQNLRRQREEDQVIQAQIVIQQPQNVVVEAEPLECRRDIQNLREQIQNKIVQIEQLKNNTKEFKKEIRKLKKENMEMKDTLNWKSRCCEEQKRFIHDIDQNGWIKNDKGIGSFKKIPANLYEPNSVELYLKNKLDMKPTNWLIENRQVRSYIKWLEDTLLARQECVDYIKETGGWWGYYTELDDDITDKRLLKYTNVPLCKKIIEERIKERIKERVEEHKKEEAIKFFMKNGYTPHIDNKGKEYVLEGDEEMKQAFINGGFPEMDKLIEKRKQKS